MIGSTSASGVSVVPRAGTWIETIPIDSLAEAINVVPRAGTWIETR